MMIPALLLHEIAPSGMIGNLIGFCIVTGIAGLVLLMVNAIRRYRRRRAGEDRDEVPWPPLWRIIAVAAVICILSASVGARDQPELAVGFGLSVVVVFSGILFAGLFVPVFGETVGVALGALPIWTGIGVICWRVWIAIRPHRRTE